MKELKAIKTLVTPVLASFNYYPGDEFGNGAYVYENKELMTRINLERGPTSRIYQYYRITYTVSNGDSTCIIGLDRFDPQYRLKHDLDYKTQEEFETVIQYYADVTIRYVIPLLDRLSKGFVAFSAKRYKTLSTNTKHLAQMFLEDIGVNVPVASQGVIAIESYLDRLRGGDYTLENFYRHEERIINAAAFFGELLISMTGRLRWEWDTTASQYTYFCLRGDDHVCPLSSVIAYWMYMPELSVYSLRTECRCLFSRMDIITDII